MREFQSFMETNALLSIRSESPCFDPCTKVETNLTWDFDLDGLIRRIKTGMALERAKGETTRCAKYAEFEDLVLNRLRQKLQAV